MSTTNSSVLSVWQSERQSKPQSKPQSKWLPSLVLPMLMIGGAASTLVTNPAQAQQSAQELQDERSQLMYEIMVAELAGRRGYLDVATESYLRAAKRTDDPRVAERATQLAVWAQEWELAEEAASRWLELDQESSNARELLAQILMRSGNPEGAALDQFANLVESAENREAVLNEIYILLMREADQPAVLSTLKGLQSRFPNEAQAHVNVARYLLQLNDRDAGLIAIDQALEANAQHGEALLMRAQILSSQGKPAEGLDDIKLALEEDSGNLSLRIGYARLLSGLGRHSEAGEQLEFLHDNASDNSDVLLSIGLLALDSKRTEEAERYFNTLLETGEHSDQAHFYLARISDQQQSFEKAIDHYEQVGRGDLYLTAQLRSAELYAAAGQVDVGVERVRSLSPLLPDPAMQPMLITTESRMLQNAGRDDAAIDVLTAALEEYPLNGELLYARALAADRAGDSQTLISDLSKLIEEEPNNGNALNALGYFLADENQRLDDAQVYLEKAISLMPNDPAVMDSLGWLRFRQGNNEAAQRLLEQAYELFPDGEIAAHLGEVLWIIGDKGAAQTVWDKALSLSPEHEKIKDTMERLTQ